MARRLAPKPRATAAPLTVSDQTAFDLLGLTERQFRDLLRAHPAIPRTVIGRRVLVRADVLVAFLDRLATAAPAADADPSSTPAVTVDGLLAELGRRSA